MKHHRKFHMPSKQKVLAMTVVLIVTAGMLLVLEKKDVINLYSSDVRKAHEEGAQTTSTAETAQEDFTDGDDRQPGSSLGEDEGSGEITDNNGSIGSGTDTSNPLVSSSGEITVFSPKKDVAVSSGHMVSGTSTLPSVSYRLIDNLSGIIVNGSLNVVNGKFSGTLNFTTNGTEGRLDIYGTKVDGTEYSNVEIPLRFK